jgi:hypothetical protein
MELVKVNTTTETQKTEPEKVFVYGLRGIRKLFNVSHATAQRYKDTIIRDAVLQQGRKIITDANMALELFNAKNGKA